MTDLSERYRQKAIASEKLGLQATDPAIKYAWAEIATAWHALAAAANQGSLGNEQKNEPF